MKRAARAPDSKVPVWATLVRVAGIYRSEFRLLFSIGLGVGIPIGLVQVLLDRLDLADPSATQAATALGAALAGFGFVLFAGQLYEGVVGNIAAFVQKGERRPKLRRVLRSLPLGRLIAANFIYVFGTLIGLLLLIVPGVILFALYAPAITLISLERLSVRSAFARSRALVKGNFWRVLLVVGIGYLVASELDLLLGVLESLTVGNSFAADWAVEALSTALLTPIAGVTAVVVTLRLIEIDRAARSV
ncbi:MAG: hypothetical protein ACR2N5_08330 [Solirubrobacterales bacterium]